MGEGSDPNAQRAAVSRADGRATLEVKAESRDPEFWKTQANTDSVEKRVARQAAVECKETGRLPLCISTQSKARTWAKEIMKANCFTKSGNDHSLPKFGLIVDKSGLPIFRSLVPNKEHR